MKHIHRNAAEAGPYSIGGPVQGIERVGGYTVVGSKGGGKGGGGGGRTPVEAPDSLHSVAYARVLDIISEGPIYGPVGGVSGLARATILDGTPIANDDGSLNFQGVRLDFRAGTQDQDHIAGFPAAENTIGIGVELLARQPWTQAITNRNLSAIRVTLEVRGLSQVNTSNGDVSGYRVDYVIEIQTDGGGWQQAVTSAFDGKTSSTYARTHRIDLPPANNGWLVRVRRLTADSTSNTVSDKTFIQALTEVVDVKMRMPMTAVVGIQVDARQFSRVPSRAYRMRGRIISVPENYDAETRTYTGTWTGSFKQAYTNNPAWIFYDMVSSRRYGAGLFVPPARLAAMKWALYTIGQYCDELVPNGMGGQEPRFTCNAYIQDASDAYRLLSDLASVFRGMVYEGAGTIMVSADMPRDPVYNFTNANAREFKYTGAALGTRFSVAQVSWNDLSDLGRAKLEVVESSALLQRYGVRLKKVTAFGCTSRGQAVRAARWEMLTSERETEGVTFTTGMEQALVAPGDVVRVANIARSGRRAGGRIRAAGAQAIEIDGHVTVRPGNRIHVNLPSGKSETRVVKGVAQDYVTADQLAWRADSHKITADMTARELSVRAVYVNEPFSEVPAPETTWVVESTELAAQLFQVIGVRRVSDTEAEIQAVQHVPGKYSVVDYETKLELPPITVIPPGVQPAPASVTLSSYSVINQGIASTNVVIAWTPARDAVKYEVQWKRNNSDWISAGVTGSAALEVQGTYSGGYLARVRAINAAEIPSAWTTSVYTQLDGDLRPPPAVTSFTAVSVVFGIGLRWTFPVGPSIIERTEIWYSETNNLAAATKLGDYAYPQNSHSLTGLSAGKQFFFWARLVDKNGVAGSYFPEINGIRGSASADASEILNYLKGQITETQLAQALLERIDSAGDAEVKIEAIKTSLAAMYTIKTQLTVDGKPYLAGIGVGTENNGGIITSQILLAAARVAILDEASGKTTTPFVVQGGQTFISQALIGAGWITNAMIGDTLQSDNFVPGISGWRIRKSTNTLEVNGSGVGYRVELGPTGLYVYNTNTGVLAVEAGVLR